MAACSLWESNMKYSELKDICNINMGQSPNSDSYNTDKKGMPFFQGNADFGEKYPVAHIWCSEPKKVAKKGDILISVRAPIGDVNYAKEECCIGRGLAALTPKKDIYIDFAFWFLKAKKNELNKRGTGSTFKAINRKILESIKVPAICYEKQIEIANILESIFAIIQKKRIELKLLDELISSRFVEMFGDPKLNDKGWNSGIISDYYEVKGGKRIPKGMGYAKGVTIHPYLRATDMKNGTILDDDIHYIDNEVYEHIKRYTVSSNDIYLTNVGVNLGAAGVIPEKYDGANLTENAVKLIPKTEKVIDGIFWTYYINSPGIQDYINERKMSVGVPKLAIFRIETMPLLLPPMGLQEQFAAFVAQVDKSKLLELKQYIN